MITTAYHPEGAAEASSEHPLGGFTRALRAHRLAAALVLLATLAGCLGWLALRTPQYTASAQVLINPRPQDDQAFLGLSVIKDTGDPTRTIQTAASLIESPEAARAAAARLKGSWTGPKVLDAVDILPQGESNILDISARDSDPDEAARIANTFVAAALRQRDQRLRRQVEPVIERLTQERSELPGTDTDADAELRSRIARLREVGSEGDPTIELARRATRAAAPEGAPASLVLLLALGAGVVLAGLVAFLLDLLGPARVTSELQLGGVTRLPVLARVPRAPWWVRRPSSGPPRVPRASREAFRALRLQLELTSESEPRAIMVSSAGRGDGRTTSVVQFGLTLAAGGHRVLLVDLDLEQPQVAQAVGAAHHADLLSVLQEGRPWREALADVPGEPSLSVAVVARDGAGVNPDDVMAPLEELLVSALADFDYVLVDAPPLGEASDVLKLASAADVLLLVARLGSTQVVDLEIAADLLDRTGTRCAGLIVVAGTLG